MIAFDFNKMVVFDLETAGHYSSLEELAYHNPRMVTLWKKLCEKKRKANDERFLECRSDDEAYFSNAGLYPEFGRIVNVSFARFIEDTEKRGQSELHLVSLGGNDEKWIISTSNNVMNKCNWVAGHNIRGFDIPFFSRRCLMHGFRPSDVIDSSTKKPWKVNIYDTQSIWNFGGSLSLSSSLDLLTTSLGMESPKTEHFGAHVSKFFWTDRDYDEIATYCEGDVASTMKVILKFSDPNFDLDSIKVVRKEPKIKIIPERREPRDQLYLFDDIEESEEHTEDTEYAE